MNVWDLIIAAAPLVKMASRLPIGNPRPPELPSLREMAPPELLAAPVGTGQTELASVQDAPPTGTVQQPIAKPGCTAADETLVIKGHLDGLAQGLGGFGVLRSEDERERMRRAVEGARAMGDEETAKALEEVFAKVPEVKDEEQARELARELEPLVERTWNLGRRCGLASRFKKEHVEMARELAKQVDEGKLTKEEAVERLRAALGA